MDSDYVARLMLSILIFAPGLVLLATALFVGILALLEKSGVLDVAQKRRSRRARRRHLVHAGNEA